MSEQFQLSVRGAIAWAVDSRPEALNAIGGGAWGLTADSSQDGATR
jgi:hypothetical protein